MTFKSVLWGTVDKFRPVHTWKVAQQIAMLYILPGHHRHAIFFFKSSWIRNVSCQHGEARVNLDVNPRLSLHATVLKEWSLLIVLMVLKVWSESISYTSLMLTRKEISCVPVRLLSLSCDMVIKWKEDFYFREYLKRFFRFISFSMKEKSVWCNKKWLYSICIKTLLIWVVSVSWDSSLHRIEEISRSTPVWMVRLPLCRSDTFLSGD